MILLDEGIYDGHCACLLPGGGVLVTGDALVTAHPTSRGRGPQLLPGHGPVHQDSAKEAVRTARENAAG